MLIKSKNYWKIRDLSDYELTDYESIVFWVIEVVTNEIIPKLTPADQKIWPLLVAGTTQKDIAAELGISPAAVNQRLRGQKGKQKSIFARLKPHLDAHDIIFWIRLSKRYKPSSTPTQLDLWDSMTRNQTKFGVF